LTLKLATVREGEEPTRRRALRSEFTADEWRLISSLADHPNRLLVVATPEGGETYAEVAHEAIFRRWQKLREWIAAERGFLAWRTGLEAARRHWQDTPEATRPEALLMGAALTQAQRWFASRRDDLSEPDRDFVGQSLLRESRRRSRARRGQVLVYALLVGIIAALAGAVFRADIEEAYWWHWAMARYASAHIKPHVLTAEAERALRPGSSFRECDKDCPEMVVVPAGRFTMGSPPDEAGRSTNEGPQQEIRLARAFAVSKFEVTFDEWQACVAVHACVKEGRANDYGFGRAQRPVIYVSWDDAKAYVAWLSWMTRRQYRLLTEAEWEYAARAGSKTAYSWGGDIKKDGKAMAACATCGSEFDGKRTAPVGSFLPNAFGLSDMHGNVWEWVEDCYVETLDGMPKDGSARLSENCYRRVIRGGSWIIGPRNVRAATRLATAPVGLSYATGFRVGRTLDAGADATTVAPRGP
jgi:formylglycine-generating enzyme required for sulfatase activity